MIDLVQVRTFLAVVDAGSFRMASSQLGISPPTATQHVKKLEAALGYQLVSRAPTRCVLTEQGLRFVRFARTLLRVAERARKELTERRLAIGASSNIGIYLLQPLVHAFQHATRFDCALEIQIGTNLETVERLEAGEVDLALMEWWDNRPDFDARVWRREQLVVIVPPTHPWAGRRSISKRALLSEPMIGGEAGTGTARILQQAFGPDFSTLKISLQLGSTEAVKQAVRAGLGISLTLASSVRDEVQAGVLHALRVRAVKLFKPLFTVVPRGLEPNAPARAFTAFLHA